MIIDFELDTPFFLSFQLHKPLAPPPISSTAQSTKAVSTRKRGVTSMTTVGMVQTKILQDVVIRITPSYRQ